jgi:ubiquinone/menaquinone biosynthesis C-methylase UbiE
MTDWNAETAEWYAAHYGDYPTNRLAVEQLDLSDSLTIVDVGCGTGSALRYAAHKVTGGTLIGIDPVPRMIQIAKNLSKEHHTDDLIVFKVGSAEVLPLDDAIAELVFAFDSIDHWQDVHKGLHEILRILKPGGKFIIVKDLSVPGAKKALNTLDQQAAAAGFVFDSQKIITTDEVSFALWIGRME